MADVIELAGKVAEMLTAYSATVDMVPEFFIRDATALKVSVIPYGTSYKPLSRGVSEVRNSVQIGFVKKATEDDADALVAQVQGIARGFLHAKILDHTCVDVAFEPIYSAPHLREKGLFVSVATLVFKAAIST